VGITVACQQFNANTSTGDQDFTISGLGASGDIKACLFICCGDTSGGDTTSVDDGHISIGATDGTNHWVSCYETQHGDTKGATSMIGATDEVIQILLPDSTTVDGEANFKEFITDGVRVTWGAALTSAFEVTVVFFVDDGTDLSVDVGTFTSSIDSSPFTVDIGTGFEPDQLILCTAIPQGGDLDGFDDTGRFDGAISFGVASNNASIEQAGLAWGAENNSNAAECTARVSPTYFGLQLALSDGVTDNGFAITDFYAGPSPAAGFEVTTTDVSAGGIFTRVIGYLALKYNGVLSHKVGIVDTPTSSGVSDFSNPLTFKPQFVMLLPSWLIATDTDTTDGNAGSNGIACFDDTREFCSSVQDEDASATTDTQSLVVDQAIYLPEDDGTVDANDHFDASFDSFNSDDFSLNFAVTVTAAARKWPYFAVGEFSAAVSARVPKLARQSVTRVPVPSRASYN